jgi:hypothetical protein
MLRIAQFSVTWRDWDNVVLSCEANDGVLEDAYNGSRCSRLAGEVDKGAALLCGIFSWDGRAVYKGMFDSKDVGMVSCAFVRAHARGRDEYQVPVSGNFREAAAQQIRATGFYPRRPASENA